MQKIINWLIAKPISRKKIGESLDVSHQVVSNVINGPKPASYLDKHAWRLCMALAPLGLTIDGHRFYYDESTDCFIIDKPADQTVTYDEETGIHWVPVYRHVVSDNNELLEFIYSLEGY